MDWHISWNTDDFEKLLRRYPAASRKAMKRRVTEALLLWERDIKDKTPVGAGPIHLRDTVFHRLSMGETVLGLVGTPASYGIPVEMGTRPHFPPIEPLRFWVEHKLGLSGAEARSVAFLIARAISRRGTKGSEMFEKTHQADLSRVMELLRQIPHDILAEAT